ncbi:glycosyltransferase [bacterium]|nr:glycosyltransferase [bacterium]
MPRLIYFSPIPWGGLYQRPQHTARILSEHFDVLWVEPKTLSHPKPPPAKVNLSFLALPVFPTNAKRPILRRLARLAERMPLLGSWLERRQAALLRKALDGQRDPILFFGHPEMAPLTKAFPDSPLIYDHMDDVLGFGEPSPILRRKLENLVKRANVVNATSERLAADMELLGAKKCLRVGNGVEFARFAEGSSLPEPAALSALPRPRALYLGSLAEWFDFDLLYEVARRMPNLCFPLVGPLRPDLEHRKAEAPGNVHFLGARPYTEVPAWMSRCEIGIIPFLRTPLTEAVDPVKLHEYLASGLPVVATPFSRELQSHGEAVSLAPDADAFAEALGTLLALPPDGESFKALAASRDWRRIMEPILLELKKLT